MSKKLIAFVLLAGSALGLLLAIGFMTLASSTLPKTEFTTVLEHVESASVGIGDPVDFWIGLHSGQPILEYKTVDDESTEFIVLMFYYRGESLLLYGKNGQLIGAQYTRGMIDRADVKWYFADIDSLNACISAMSVE